MRGDRLRHGSCVRNDGLLDRFHLRARDEDSSGSIADHQRSWRFARRRKHGPRPARRHVGQQGRRHRRRRGGRHRGQSRPEALHRRYGQRSRRRAQGRISRHRARHRQVLDRWLVLEIRFLPAYGHRAVRHVGERCCPDCDDRCQVRCAGFLNERLGRHERVRRHVAHLHLQPERGVRGFELGTGAIRCRRRGHRQVLCERVEHQREHHRAHAAAERLLRRRTR